MQEHAGSLNWAHADLKENERLDFFIFDRHVHTQCILFNLEDWISDMNIADES